MKENTDERIDDSIQTFAGAPGVPGGTTTNFLIHPDVDINTYPGGREAFFSRPGVTYNTGASSNIGEYANFSSGNNAGFLIYSRDGSPTDFIVRKKNRDDTVWGERYKLYHTGNLDPLSFATKEDLKTKADLDDVSGKVTGSYVEPKILDLAHRIDTKVDKTTIPRMHCSGHVSASGSIQSNGRLLNCSRISTGKYKITPREGEFPRLFIVNVTLDNSSPEKTFATVSDMWLTGFTVNIGKNVSMFDCGFNFLMVEY